LFSFPCIEIHPVPVVQKTLQKSATRKTLLSLKNLKGKNGFQNLRTVKMFLLESLTFP
jgi:hypothetical protein